MKVKDIMSSPVVCCTADTSLEQVAKMMMQNDCGAIPVVDNDLDMRVVGIITDRDITVRCVARGCNPLDSTAGEYMTPNVATVQESVTVEECCRIMEEHQVRRVPVTDQNNCCQGIVAQADIARKASEEKTAEVVKEVSEPVHVG